MCGGIWNKEKLSLVGVLEVVVFFSYLSNVLWEWFEYKVYYCLFVVFIGIFI